MALGGIAGSALAGLAVRRLGSRTMTVAGTAGLVLGLPLVAVAPSLPALLLVTTCLGMVDGLCDVAMNTQAVRLQQRTPARSITNRFHAAWSLGTVVGGFGGAAMAALRVPLGLHLCGVSVLLATVLVRNARALDPSDEPVVEVAAPITAGTPADRTRAGAGRRALLVVAGTGAAVGVVEGVPGDWAAVFGTDEHGAGAGVAGLGYAAVTTGMLTGRMLGDRLTDRAGVRRVFSSGLAVAAAGLAVVVTSPAQAVALAGFLVCGLGISVLFPAIYRAAGSQPGIATGTGLAVMTTAARVGFLASPLVVGAVSEAAGLRTAIGALVGAAAVVAFLSGRRVTAAVG